MSTDVLFFVSPFGLLLINLLSMGLFVDGVLIFGFFILGHATLLFSSIVID